MDNLINTDIGNLTETGLRKWAAEVLLALRALEEQKAAEAPVASPEQIDAARRVYAEVSDDDIEIDDDAKISECDDGHWIQAWVWMPQNESSDSEDSATSCDALTPELR